jgi:hypothetical protein
MAQSLEVNIKTTSDVPQAMDKAKAATNSFGSQVEGIGKKFGSSFKDIFLSFLGPMAILTTVLGLIGKMIADNQRKTQEAHQAALDNTNELMSAQDRFYANKREKEKLTEEQIKQAKLERENVTVEFLRNDPRGHEIINKFQPPKMGGMYGDYEFTNPTASILSKNKTIQDQVQAFIAADMAKNPAAVAPTGPTSFKTPEGFGNVVGVGANPVMEAMTLQLEESRKQTALLENISRGSGGGVPTDFTKSPIPSRGALLKAGN